MDIGALPAQYGYAFVFLGALAEGESVLLVGGFAAHRGLLKLPELMVVAFIAATLGDQFCFYLGRRHEPTLLARFPSLARRVERLQPMLQSHPNAAVLSVRFLYGLRTAGPIELGTQGVSRWRFARLNMPSAAVWSVAFCLLGYQFGNALHWLLDDLRSSVEETVLAALLAAAVVWAIWRRLRRA